MNVPVGGLIEPYQPTEDEQRQQALNALCRILSDHTLNYWPGSSKHEAFEAAIAPVKDAIKSAIKKLL